MTGFQDGKTEKTTPAHGRGPEQEEEYILRSTCPPAEGDPQVLPNGQMGVWYSEKLTATGGVPPYTFIAGSGMPPGLSLSAGGLLSGAPTGDGDFSVRVLIRDANGCSQRIDVFITIEKSNASQKIIPAASDSSFLFRMDG